MTVLLCVYAAIFGAIIGSFLNVVIHRYPLEQSIVSPPSRCPKCGVRIRAYDNIPVLSWLILLGRCRSCREPIAMRYPLIELANALFYLAIYLRTGPAPAFLIIAAFVSMTIVLIFIDLDYQFLPDVVDLPGIIVGIAAGAMALGRHFPTLTISSSLVDSLLGAALGGGLLYGMALLYKGIRGVDGMGLGDVKMLAMLGAMFGWKPLLPVLFLASVAGAAAGIYLAIRNRQSLMNALPFGVFLGLSALAILFFGNEMVSWYLSRLLA